MAAPDLGTLTRIAEEAAELVLSMQERASAIVDKGQGDLATDADFASEKLIISRLNDLYPDIPVIAEESAECEDIPAQCFVVDPIDGTIPFSRKSPGFGVTLAYLSEQKPQLGVIVLPAMQKTVVVERGQGCFLNGERITVSGRVVPAHFTLAMDLCFMTTTEHVRTIVEPFVGRFQMLFSFGSAVRAAVGLLSGEVDVYVSPGAKIWDFAVMALSMEEAGGVSLSLSGEEILWRSLRMGGVFAVNRAVASTLVQHTRKLGTRI